MTKFLLPIAINVNNKAVDKLPEDLDDLIKKFVISLLKKAAAKTGNSVDDLLGNMPGETFSTNTPRTLGDFNPELKFDFSKLQNKQKTDFTSHIKDKWKMPGSTESEWKVPELQNSPYLSYNLGDFDFESDDRKPTYYQDYK